jgi:hypothetical protein
MTPEEKISHNRENDINSIGHLICNFAETHRLSPVAAGELFERCTASLARLKCEDTDKIRESAIEQWAQ